MTEAIVTSDAASAGHMLGVAFALAASLTDGGRAALDHGFWETTLPYITDTGDRLPLPTSPQRELLRGADAINTSWTHVACSYSAATRRLDSPR